MILLFCTVQISLTLHNESLREALRAHWDFVRRNTVRLGWFFLICALHFFLLTAVDAILRGAIADRVAGMILWKVMYVTLARVGDRMVAGLVGVSVPAMRDGADQSGDVDPVLTCYPATVDAAKITRESKSNLALAFVSLGAERRRDITTFYAFCRVIDDIADSTQLSVAEKAAGLAAWRGWLSHAGSRGRRARG